MLPKLQCCLGGFIELQAILCCWEPKTPVLRFISSCSAGKVLEFLTIPGGSVAWMFCQRGYEVGGVVVLSY